ncbi:hypothetical protein LCGC14_2879980 [marine sediment metagenome]|uniref:HTH cro/C1-type domain-containing protein n=1 Tax=marine sediment metagenome TaxID=412755 RepID=A0A0F8Y0K9_9ZZZZ
MTSHPNRGKSRTAPPGNPTPDEIIQLRHDAGLTQTEASQKIWSALRTWQGYEATSGDTQRRMHPAIWWCFKQRTKHLRSKEE